MCHSPTPSSEKTVHSPSTTATAPSKQDTEPITRLPLTQLHPFPNHPFTVRNDAEMRAMVASVKEKGVTQPVIVRPKLDGAYEIVSGHRRHFASVEAELADIPCIVRILSDEQAITQMVEDNTNQRSTILPSERAKALKMQLDAIKRQGARRDRSSGQPGSKKEGADELHKRSNEIVAERNNMTVKQVQRFIKLNDLTPELLQMVDDKKLPFTPAVEIAFIRRKNQQLISLAIEGQQAAPSLVQAQQMRELDQQSMLNADVIDSIMSEEKKEVEKVILSTQELSQYFGKDKSPREMKEQIMVLLDEWASKQKQTGHRSQENERSK